MKKREEILNSIGKKKVQNLPPHLTKHLFHVVGFGICKLDHKGLWKNHGM